MKLRIVSGGTHQSTYVEDADTGERLEYVTGISWFATMQGVTAEITVLNVELRAVVDDPVVVEKTP